jgi:hypothetical protein
LLDDHGGESSSRRAGGIASVLENIEIEDKPVKDVMAFVG